jgi:hypothetical protein
MGIRILFKSGVIFFISIFLISCKKKDVEASIESPKFERVNYYDHAPDIYLNSVQSSTAYPHLYDPIYCFKTVPTKKVVEAGVDLDGDNFGDIKFALINSYYQQSSPHTCPQGFYIFAVCARNSDSIIQPRAKPNEWSYREFGKAQFYNAGDTINDSGKGVVKAYLRRVNIFDYTGLPNITITGDTYIGIKRRSNNKTYCGWIRIEMSNSPDGSNDITIKDCAFSINSIVAGQKN